MQTITKNLLRRMAASLLLVFAFAGAVSAQVQVSLLEVNGRPGQTVTLDVNVSGVTNLNSFQFTVNPNPAVGATYVGYEKTGTLSAGFTVSPASTVAGNGTVIGGFANPTPATQSGTLIKLKFLMGPAGTGTVTLSGFEVNGEPIVGGNPVVAYNSSSIFIDADDVTKRIGDPLPIVVRAVDAMTNLVAFQADVKVWNPAVLSGAVTVAKGSLTGTWSNFQINPLGGGVYRVGAFGPAVTGSGTLFVLNAIAGAAGTSLVTFSNVTFNNSTGGAIAVAADFGTVTVTVNAVPTADSKVATVPEDGSVAITLSGNDADGDALTFAIVTNPAHGAIALVGNVATYTPTANYNGPDTFTYRANDGYVNSSPATVSITVSPVNDPPVWTAQMANRTVVEDGGLVTFAYGATDVDGTALTFAKVQGPAGSTVSASGAFSWDPTGKPGMWPVQVSVTDGTVTLNSTVATITVLPVNGLSAILAGVHEVKQNQ